MTNHRYPALLIAALAATFLGAAVAQTQSDDTSRMPANKGTAQESQTQPSTDQTDKMKGQDQSAAQQNAAANSAQKAKPADQQAMKSDQSGKAATQSKTAGDHSAMAGDKAKTDKHAGDQTAMAEHRAKSGDQTAMADHKMKHGTKSKGQTAEAGSPDDKAYRDALRDCVKQQDQSQRDNCLDSAIEKFHRNA